MTWTPEQYWEFVGGLAGDFERDQMRDALDQHGLRVADVAAGPIQSEDIATIPIHWARPIGATLDSMRKHVWETGLAPLGDTILVWVNEGDFLHAQLTCGAVEHKNDDGVTLTRPLLDTPQAEGGK